MVSSNCFEIKTDKILMSYTTVLIWQPFLLFFTQTKTLAN